MVGRLRGWIVVLAIGPAACTEDAFDFGAPRSCEVVDQNEWIYGLMQDAYLWAPDLPEIDPASFESPEDTMKALRTGHDRWSRVSDKARTQALFEEGKTISLGFRTQRNSRGELTVSWISPGSSAEAAGMRRGDGVRTIGGFTIAQLDAEDRWSDVYGADEPGVAVQVEFTPPGSAPVMTTLVKDWIEIETVPIHTVFDTSAGPVGYIMFNGFVDTAPDPLDAAFEGFVAAGVRRVVVDLRYNGGGRVAVARQLVDLLVGDVADGEINYSTEYGPGLDSENVIRTVDRRDGSIRDLERVVFITTGSTLSASELVINATRAHVDTRIVGGTTGGKPVGSHQWELCDKIASPITFRLVNAEGTSDYFDGLAADCEQIDDLDAQLGTIEEDALAHALHVAAEGACLPPPPAREGAATANDDGEGEGSGVAPSDEPRRGLPRLHDVEGLDGVF